MSPRALSFSSSTFLCPLFSLCWSSQRTESFAARERDRKSASGCLLRTEKEKGGPSRIIGSPDLNPTEGKERNNQTGFLFLTVIHIMRPQTGKSRKEMKQGLQAKLDPSLPVQEGCRT
mmetsp:Transcript_14955/g.30203  ORF Transcript_14955/g.30203 Transcript_14955/m.30203 type:complete len:118 (-) Transcript_14955:415-768(-)